MTSFILSDNEKNDRFANETHDLKKYFTSKKNIYINNTEDSQLILGLLSESLKDTHIFLYDNNALIEHYPEGMVTENLILIPVEKFENMRKNFAQITDKEYLTTSEKYFAIQNSSFDWANALVKPLIHNLELKLNTQLSEDEFTILTKTTIDYVKLHNPLSINTTETFTPTIITNKDLLENIKNITNEDLSINHFLEKSINSSAEKSRYFKQWLNTQHELLENLPTFTKSVENLPNITNDSINFNELKDKLRNFDISIDSGVKILSEIKQVVDNMKKECQGDQKMFIENSSSTLFPILHLADESMFSWSVQYIKDQVFATDKNNLTTSSIISDFCQQLNHFCYEDTRNTMIDIMSGQNLFSRMRLSGDAELIKDMTASVTTKPKM